MVLVERKEDIEKKLDFQLTPVPSSLFKQIHEKPRQIFTGNGPAWESEDIL